MSKRMDLVFCKEERMFEIRLFFVVPRNKKVKDTILKFTIKDLIEPCFSCSFTFNNIHEIAPENCCEVLNKFFNFKMISLKSTFFKEEVFFEFVKRVLKMTIACYSHGGLEHSVFSEKKRVRRKFVSSNQSFFRESFAIIDKMQVQENGFQMKAPCLGYIS